MGAQRSTAYALGRAARRVPGLRRVPIVTLLSAAEVALLARDHVLRLTPEERRRGLELLRSARGRPSNLPPRERRELEALIARLEPRLLAGEAAERFSPVRLPRRVVRGPRTRR